MKLISSLIVGMLILVALSACSNLSSDQVVNKEPSTDKPVEKIEHDIQNEGLIYKAETLPSSEGKIITKEHWLSIEGYIISIENGRFLLVEGITKKDVSNKRVEEILNDGPPAIWFSVKNTDNLNIGDNIVVFYSVELQSYPGQSEALEVRLLSKDDI